MVYMPFNFTSRPLSRSKKGKHQSEPTLDGAAYAYYKRISDLLVTLDTVGCHTIRTRTTEWV